MGPSILVGAGDLDEPARLDFISTCDPPVSGGRGQSQSSVEHISLSMVPVLDRIPLVEIQYRTTVVAEYVFESGHVYHVSY